MGACVVTHTTLSELLGVDGGGEVESPGVAGGGVLPVDEALAGLSDSRPYGGQSRLRNRQTLHCCVVSHNLAVYIAESLRTIRRLRRAYIANLKINYSIIHLCAWKGGGGERIIHVCVCVEGGRGMSLYGICTNIYSL
jgi:hypothetical protein